MKKYLVIGNPINHSLSPKLHNYWLKKNNIEAIYEKKNLDEKDVVKIIDEVKNEKIDGINVTKPFKKFVIPFLDKLTPIADEAQSVNTIYKESGMVIGHNTDVDGFQLALKYINYNVKNRIVIVLGAGGVVSSIILALKKLGASKIILSNRTKEKAEFLKKKYSYIEIVDWGKIPSFDMLINATSIGLKKSDEINLNYKDIGSGKLFYDVIYNPNETNFLLNAKKFGNQTENGKMMFIYQAQQSFKIWHKTTVNIDKKIIKLLD